ncbi:MAG: Slp family lipoprotein [Algicola sp.]|nr:Slp family lipoprotein [Algicola sp.]
MRKKITLSVLVLALAGCTNTTPDFVQVETPANLIKFQQMIDGKQSHASEKARWGGMISKVTQHQNRTILEVANLELSKNAKPMIKKESAGLFKVYLEDSTDAQQYEQGNLITVVGDISLSERGQIGDYAFRVPTLNNASVHVWQQGAKQSRQLSIAIYSASTKGKNHDNGDKQSFNGARNGRIGAQMKKNAG